MEIIDKLQAFSRKALNAAKRYDEENAYNAGVLSHNAEVMANNLQAGTTPDPTAYDQFTVYDATCPHIDGEDELLNVPLTSVVAAAWLDKAKIALKYIQVSQ